MLSCLCWEMKQVLVARSLASWLLQTKVCTTQIHAVGLACWTAGIGLIEESVF